MKLRTLLGITIVSTGLIGCATSKPQTCDTQSLNSGGFGSALANTVDNRTPTSDFCNNVEATRATEGTASTIETACTFRKGFFAGEHGAYPDGQCLEYNRAEYETGYTIGRKILDANNRLEIVSEALETSRKRLWMLESSADGIGRAAEISRVKANIVTLIQVRDLESRRLHNLHADNTH